MIRTTPFHERLTELNDQHLYTHWSGFLSALRYTHAPKHEYFAVRNGVGIFDTSPLFKYRITGPDATDFVGGVVVRDLSALRPGRAAYTSWCDDQYSASLLRTLRAAVNCAGPGHRLSR